MNAARNGKTVNCKTADCRMGVGKRDAPELAHSSKYRPADAPTHSILLL
jgi:hypothetical protein